jgi:hypothetical protein
MSLQVLINADASAEKNGWGGNFFVFFIKNFPAEVSPMTAF